MRQAIVITGLLAVVVTGLLISHSPAAGQQNPTQGIVRWEYKVQSTFGVTIASSGPTDALERFEKLAEATQAFLNQHGDDRWELISVGEGLAIFKRPKK